MDRTPYPDADPDPAYPQGAEETAEDTLDSWVAASPEILVGTWSGIYRMVREREPGLPVSVAAEVAARLVALVDPATVEAMEEPTDEEDELPAPGDIGVLGPTLR